MRMRGELPSEGDEMFKTSRLIARVLRHSPQEIGIELAPGGWVEIDLFLRQLRRHGHRLTRAELEEIVATNDKARFTISGGRIRAAQGHSVDVDLELPALTPPAELYHGTATRNLDAIFASGLHPGRRRQVHLSPDPETALRVGSRHGKPTVVRIDAGQMHQDGYLFYRSDNGVWLTDHVPARFIGFGTLNA